jgi:ubiquinone/menaquinone biosynthesis C-methylase UbiE
MNPAGESINFDRAADYYDQTRGLSGPLASGGMQMILDRLQERAGPGALLLEVGTGTGRIAIPLLERGARLYGCDLSYKMMARQRAKRADARLAQADATVLPYGPAQFDGALTVHVLHLIGGWRTVLHEIRRVLRPGAAYVNVWTPNTRGDADARLRQYWRRRVEAHGASWRRPGVQSREELVGELEQMGARFEEVNVARSVQAVTPQAILDNIARRVYSETWVVPDDVFQQTIEELRAWAAENYADLSQPEQIEQHFVFDVIHFQPVD